MEPITIEVGNVFLRVGGGLPSDVIEEIQNKMSYVVPGYKFTPVYKKNPNWDGTKSVARRFGSVLQAPTGLYSYLMEILTAHDIPFRRIDQRAAPRPSVGYSIPDFNPYDYQSNVIQEILNRQRGVAKMATGCHQIGQGILMFDGSIKPVEQISVGEEVMGPDSNPRKVLELYRGYGKMYRVSPVKGDGFTVNEDHVLSLVRTNVINYKKESKTNQNGRRLAGNIIDIKLNDYLLKSKAFKHKHKLFRSAVDFKKQNNLPVDPYFLGLLLGDGVLSSGYVGVCAKSKEIIDACYEQAQKNTLEVQIYKYTNRIAVYALKSKERNGTNILRDSLKKIGIMGKTCGNKFIPEIYKTASKEARLQLLAGMIDSDGSYSHGFDYISKSKKLSEDFAFVCRSLGFAVYINPCIKGCQTGAKGLYYRVSVSGCISQVPCRTPHKQASIRKQKKDVLRTGFTLYPSENDDFYGFRLDGDGRYLLSDFTVTHNSGKTEVAIASAVGAGVFPYIFYVPSCDLLEQSYMRFRKYIKFNGVPAEIGRVGGGHCDVQPITIMTVQSAQRAIEGKFTKFDDEQDDDKTKFDEQQKTLVRNLINEAQHIAIDECQHTSASTIQSVMNNSFSARYRVGFSASPWRDDGMDILIEACFGRRLCDIDASFLIQRGFLVQPQITFNHFKQTLDSCATYQEQYKTYVVENEFRNEWIAKTALKHIGLDRMTIILVKWVRHAEILASMIPGSEILSSSGEFKKSATKREAILEKMRSKEVMCAIGTSLLDEGIDVPAATAGIFAGGGKSSTRALQRVGRFIRKDKSDVTKKMAYIEEIHDHCMYLNHHAQTRRKILSTEREFLILDNRVSLGE